MIIRGHIDDLTRYTYDDDVDRGAIASRAPDLRSVVRAVELALGFTIRHDEWTTPLPGEASGSPSFLAFSIGGM